jgi:hypothetical protein
MRQYFVPIVVLGALWYVADRYERSQEHHEPKKKHSPTAATVEGAEEVRTERPDNEVHGQVMQDVLYAQAMGLNPVYQFN